MRTGARLQLKFAHLDRYWWKFYNAARFELWRVDSEGRRSGEGAHRSEGVLLPARPHPHRARAARLARQPHYPACSTNRAAAPAVTLGTSVGWADIYPPSYPEQWIDVTGLRGCFAYVHIADPENGIYESNEDNNEAQVIVRLPFRARRAERVAAAATAVARTGGAATTGVATTTRAVGPRSTEMTSAPGRRRPARVRRPGS